VSSVLVSLLHSLRVMVRSRGSLHLEILALGHQVAVLNLVPLAALLDRGGSSALGVAVAGVERSAAGARSSLTLCSPGIDAGPACSGRGRVGTSRDVQPRPLRSVR
jgi:hypothetical protein